MEIAKQAQSPSILISEEENGLDIKNIIYTFLRYWPWFFISVFVFALLAFLYLRYTTPVYKINAKILIKDDKNSSIDPQDLLSQLDIFNTVNNVDNEEQVFQTYFLIRKVVDELQLNINYFTVGNIKSTELYDKAPFKVKVLYLKDSIPKQAFELSFSPKNSSFFLKSDSISGQFKFYDTIKTTNANFVIIPSENPFLNTKYQYDINNPDDVTQNYLKNLTFELPDKQASVIAITLQETVPQKGEDILNKLYEIYTRINEEDKNKIADSTISFIDNRLAVVSSELSNVEKNIEEFKTKNQLSTDLDDQAKLVLSDISDVQKQLTDQDVQISVVQSLEDHVKGNSTKVVPNAGVIQDPTYITTVQEYNTLVLERDRQLETTKPDNPVVQSLNSQIATLRTNLLISLENIQNQMEIARAQLANKNSDLLQNIKSGPAKERVFLDISRQQNVKQQLYLYLLQKREETAISKSGTLSNSRLIEPAKSDNLPFTPKKSIIYLIGLCAGIIVPAGTIYLKNTLNNKIIDSTDITKETTIPILGEIGHNTTGKTIVAEQNSRTSLAEQFRAFRTNLQFLLKGKEHQIIMITSSTSGEGKSFLSINLGLSLAISNKKVILVELDLRKPKISKELDQSANSGFTDYLISKISKEQLIKPTLNPNLFLISAGTIPPNPAELLLSREVDELFAWLKTQFDYIIIDTPPAGVVIDAVIIGRFADATIYVVRQRYTLKQQLQIVNDFKENKKINNLSILINDVHLNKAYGYGYTYGYGYGSDYYSDSKRKKSFFGKLKNNKPDA